MYLYSDDDFLLLQEYLNVKFKETSHGKEHILSTGMALVYLKILIGMNECMQFSRYNVASDLKLTLFIYELNRVELVDSEC